MFIFFFILYACDFWFIYFYFYEYNQLGELEFEFYYDLLLQFGISNNNRIIISHFSYAYHILYAHTLFKRHTLAHKWTDMLKDVLKLWQCVCARLNLYKLCYS